MRVILKNSSSSKRLIKGHTYEIDYMYNLNGNGHLSLKEIVGTFQANSFSKLDGSEVDSINIPAQRESYTIEDIEVGSILYCTNKNIALIYAGLYKVESININNSSVKLEGIDRPYKYYNFRKASTSEAREVNLQKVINKKDILIKTKNLKKIDYLENKEFELMKVISQSILDVNRHELDILDWGIDKHSKLGLIREDFNELKEMTLKDILSLIDKTKE